MNFEDLQWKFRQSYHIYKIVSDIDLEGNTLILGSDSILDFQGGKLLNGSVNMAGGLILPMGINLDKVSTNVSFIGTFGKSQILFDSELGCDKLYNGSKWVRLDGKPLTIEYMSKRKIGSLDDSGNEGDMALYTKTPISPVFNIGSKWVNADGNPVTRKIGITSDRPTENLYIGCYYYDKTLNKPIWIKSISEEGVATWIDATGAIV